VEVNKMIFGLDALLAIGGLVVPPAFDFIKKKFIKSENDSPERTIGSLATSKPEILPAYVEALAKTMAEKTRWFNRDVIDGKVSSWVANWRACIRPALVTMAIVHWTCILIWNIPIDPGLKASEILLVSEWCGERLTLK
jgi:hypothetical protein